MIRIGIRGIPDGKLPKEVDFFEIDAIDPNTVSKRDYTALRKRLYFNQSLTLSLGLFFLNAKDDQEHQERVAIAIEKASLLKPESTTILVPGSLANDPNLTQRINIIQKEFHLAGIPNLSLFCKFMIQSKLPLALDPTQDPKPKSDHWRILGHHPERWVRLYSQDQMKRLARLAKQIKPKRILFAHSQRIIQSIQFKKFLT